MCRQIHHDNTVGTTGESLICGAKLLARPLIANSDRWDARVYRIATGLEVLRLEDLRLLDSRQ